MRTITKISTVVQSDFPGESNDSSNSTIKIEYGSTKDYENPEGFNEEDSFDRDFNLIDIKEQAIVLEHDNTFEENILETVSDLTKIVFIKINCKSIQEDKEREYIPVKFNSLINNTLSIKACALYIEGVSTSNIETILLSEINVPQDRKVVLNIKIGLKK